MADFSATRLAMQKYAKDAQKLLVKRSVWDQLSNRVEANGDISNAVNEVPATVVHVVEGSTDKKQRSVTCTMAGKLGGDYVAGANKAEGTEGTVGLSSIVVYYNLWRRAFKIQTGTRGVEGNIEDFYVAAKQSTSISADYAGELRDYFHHSALMEGASPILTSSSAWTGYSNATLQSAPVSVALHPKIFYKGQTAAITRSSTYATDLTNVMTALATMTSASDFDLDSVNSLATICANNVQPLQWSAGGQEVKWIVLISSLQAIQLRSDSAWVTAMQNAEKRGPENRLLSGILGNYRGMLIVENYRAPVFDLTNSVFQYVKPNNTNNDYLLGSQSITRTAKGATTVATGMCEIAICLGAGAVYRSLPEDIFHEEQDSDYKMVHGYLVGSQEGHQRADFLAADGSTTTNQSSALYFTGTPSVSL